MDKVSSPPLINHQYKPCWKCGELTDNKVNCCDSYFCNDCHFGLYLRIAWCVQCEKTLKEDKAFLSDSNKWISPDLISCQQGKNKDYKLRTDPFYDKLDYLLCLDRLF